MYPNRFFCGSFELSFIRLGWKNTFIFYYCTIVGMIMFWCFFGVVVIIFFSFFLFLLVLVINILSYQEFAPCIIHVQLLTLNQHSHKSGPKPQIGINWPKFVIVGFSLTSTRCQLNILKWLTITSSSVVSSRILLGKLNNVCQIKG